MRIFCTRSLVLSWGCACVDDRSTLILVVLVRLSCMTKLVVGYCSLRVWGNEPGLCLVWEARTA